MQILSNLAEQHNRSNEPAYYRRINSWAEIVLQLPVAITAPLGVVNVYNCNDLLVGSGTFTHIWGGAQAISGGGEYQFTNLIEFTPSFAPVDRLCFYLEIVIPSAIDADGNPVTNIILYTETYIIEDQSLTPICTDDAPMYEAPYPKFDCLGRYYGTIPTRVWYANGAPLVPFTNKMRFVSVVTAMPSDMILDDDGNNANSATCNPIRFGLQRNYMLRGKQVIPSWELNEFEAIFARRKFTVNGKEFINYDANPFEIIPSVCMYALDAEIKECACEQVYACPTDWVAPTPVYGCNDPQADNYNPLANVNNGSCLYYCVAFGNLQITDTQISLDNQGDNLTYFITPIGANPVLHFTPFRVRIFDLLTIPKVLLFDSVFGGHAATPITVPIDTSSFTTTYNTLVDYYNNEYIGTFDGTVQICIEQYAPTTCVGYPSKFLNSFIRITNAPGLGVPPYTGFYFAGPYINVFGIPPSYISGNVPLIPIINSTPC
jgi:hypothetical protein